MLAGESSACGCMAHGLRAVDRPSCVRPGWCRTCCAAAGRFQCCAARSVSRACGPMLLHTAVTAAGIAAAMALAASRVLPGLQRPTDAFCRGQPASASQLLLPAQCLTWAPASHQLGRPTSSVNRMPATAAMAQRPFISSASWNQARRSGFTPRRRGSKPLSPAEQAQATSRQNDELYIR
jgi:hypothetical protein